VRDRDGLGVVGVKKTSKQTVRWILLYFNKVPRMASIYPG
jgi:hypothetical protein